MTFQNIPVELRERQQWCVWRYEQRPGEAKPTKPLYDPRSGWPAKSTDPATWVGFQTAVDAAATGKYSGIGYVVNKDDPYTFIDLDSYDPKLSQEDKDRHTRIANAFQGYAERSPSGVGLHLIVKGKVPAGRRRGGIELYSDARYMTMTGDIWRPGPIVEQQDLLTTLWEEIGGPESLINTIVNGPQTEEDNAICDRAYRAENGQLFLALYTGKWSDLYGSQSEADQALINIIAFYTKNQDQVKRIFRSSALGQRDKAKREAYVNYSVNKAWDNQPPEINFDALRSRLIEETPVEQPKQLEVSNDVYSVPPNGLLGDVASYIYSAAARPVAEIALCGAIGLLAGICGRSYNIGGSGLNHYLLLLAPTGSGKESIASGISKLMGEVQKAVPASMDFIGPGEIRSDAALLKYLAKKSPSFLTIGGEFGHTLEQMAALNGSSHIKAVKRVMLDLYGKSGYGDVLRPTIYSDAANNTNTLNSPAFSFIGESAPERFFNSVDEALVSDGLLPRFTLIEYTGPQPPLNANRNHPPAARLVSDVAGICAQSLTLNQAGKVIDIQLTPEAQKLMDSFEESCRNKINNGDEVTKQLWNRAHIRALKLAGLYAVGENAFQPLLSLKAAQWAINLSTHNTERLLGRFERGEVGVQTTDDKHIKDVLKAISNYLNKHPDPNKRTLTQIKLWHDRVIDYTTLQNAVIARAAFRNARMGPTNALRTALKNLVSRGDLIEISRPQMKQQYSSTSEAYVIADPAAIQKI